MEAFLSLVAKDLIKRFGTNLADVTVVFPSLRARLFFNNYLYQEANTPLWAPQYISIDELFEKASPFHKADSIQLIGDLYQSYIETYNSHSEKPTTETLDEFFFFGEILLNDFDEVDKNLVNAKSLFSNLQDLDRLKDDFTHLTENQIEAVSRHFKEVFVGESKLKSAFWSIWNILGDVYLNFRRKLQSQNAAYPGMLMRDVIEDETIEFTAKQYIFVGFNVLNKCEEQLFKRLKHKSLFYWDYDTYYIKQEAGRYIETNIQKFGSALDPTNFDSFLSENREIIFMASPSENGQIGTVSPWIDSLNKNPDFKNPDSAIVLCNESILPTVMHAIPPSKVENVNITMGFPIDQTPIASFLQVLTEMQIKGNSAPEIFHYKYALPVLRHPYTRIIFPEAREVEKLIVDGNIFFPDIIILKDVAIFHPTADAVELSKYLLDLVERLGKAYKEEGSFTDVYDGLYQESIFRAYQIVNRLYGLLQSNQWTLEKSTFLRLLRKLLSTTQVPFHGEPVKGLQIMGVLETRTLDFENLLLLSVNEGFMPGTNSDNTFIPQFLRAHFNLNTIEHQDSIYAYYFYRLIQRAKKITLVFNTDKTQTGKAEISRFLLQLLIDPQLNIKRYTLHSPVKPWKIAPIFIPKTEKIIQEIKEKYDFNTNPEAKPLTPSNLNTFIDCSLRFYLQKVKGYESEDELPDELDSSIFGTIFHHAAEYLYREIGRISEKKTFTPFIVEKEHLDVYLSDGADFLIKRLVSKAFEKDYFKGRVVDESQYNGEQLINFRVICKMLRRLIEFDKKRAPFKVIGLEWRDYHLFTLEDSNTKLKIGGIVDRLEEKDGKITILDYKTGSSSKPYKNIEELFIENEKRASHVFQTFVYASVMIRQQKFGLPIVPALLYIQEAGKENYSPVIEYNKEPIEDFNTYNIEFEELFIKKISDLFNPDIPFQQTTLISNCAYCEFRELCNR